MNKEVNRRSVWASAILGALIFIMIYGMEVLNPTNTEWLYAQGDLTKHQLAWEGFRFSDWHFPIGLMDSLYYPHNTSIIFHDILPIFAIPFKVLSPILPDSFQYWGIWGILSFALNGALSAKILQKYLKSNGQIVTGSVFFICSFQMLQRMFEHTSLAAHWVIFLPMMMLVYNETLFSSSKSKIYMSIFLGILTSVTHIYFLLICGIILFGVAIFEVWNTKKINISLSILASYIGSAGIIIYLLGGFSGNTLAQSGGLGHFSFNLNGFFNPMDSGLFLKTLPAGDGQYEGFSYLGAGILVLLIVTLVNIISSVNWHTDYKCITTPKILCIFIINVIAIVIALSPTITFGEKELFKIPLPPIIYDLWAIFRSTGRMAWIPVYFLFLFALCGDIRYCKKEFKTYIISACLLLQLLDLSPRFITLHNKFAANQEYSSELSSALWNDLSLQRDIKHVVYVSGSSFEEMRPIAIWALRNGYTLNKFSSARALEIDSALEAKEMLAQPQEDTIYIGRQEDKNFFINTNLNYYYADSYFVGTAYNLSNKYRNQSPVILFDYKFYSQENNEEGIQWRWSDNDAAIKIYNGTNFSKEVTLSFDIATGYTDNANIKLIIGETEYDIVTNSSGNHFEHSFIVPPEGLTLKLTTDSPKATPVATDTRTLYMRIYNWSLF